MLLDNIFYNFNAIKCSFQSQKGRDLSEDRGVDGRIIKMDFSEIWW
jgi:hypothetical protein